MVKQIQKEKNPEFVKIGTRFKELRSVLKITHDDLTEVLFISRPTLSKLENGIGFSDHTIFMVSNFFGMNISEFTNYNLECPERNFLIQKIKEFHGNAKPSYAKVLDQPLTLKGIIEFNLVNSEFLNQKRSVKEIRKWIIETKLMTEIKENLSQSLNYAVKADMIGRERNNKKDYTYFNKVKRRHIT